MKDRNIDLERDFHKTHKNAAFDQRFFFYKFSGSATRTAAVGGVYPIPNPPPRPSLCFLTLNIFDVSPPLRLCSSVWWWIKLYAYFNFPAADRHHTLGPIFLIPQRVGGWVGLGAGYIPRRYTRERPPISVLTGLDVEQLCWCANQRYRLTKLPLR